jgi:hypothetical protein
VCLRERRTALGGFNLFSSRTSWVGCPGSRKSGRRQTQLICAEFPQISAKN